MKMLVRWFARLRRSTWFAFHRLSFKEAGHYRRPRLFIDLSVIARHDAKTGIQRVVRALWSELSRRRHPVYDFVPVYAGAAHGYQYAELCSKTGDMTLTREIVRGQRGDKFLGLDLSAHYLPHCVEQFAAWREAGATVHNVVYDLLPIEQPRWFTPTTQGHFERWFAAVTRHSDQLLCISDTVAAAVRGRISGTVSPKVDRIQLSGNIAGSNPSSGTSDDFAELLERVDSRPTILMVGTVEPRKGYASALNAFEALWDLSPDDSPDLLIVGKPGWCTQKLQARLLDHPMNGTRLHWRPGISDEALTELYERCAAVLITSLGEGFGLPVLEAAFHGKWVLCRDLPVFREQNLPNCLYFGDDSPTALGSRIGDLVDRAKSGPPPAVELLDWSDCLDDLLETLSIDPRPLEVVAAGDSDPAAPVPFHSVNV